MLDHRLLCTQSWNMVKWWLRDWSWGTISHPNLENPHIPWFRHTDVVRAHTVCIIRLLTWCGIHSLESWWQRWSQSEILVYVNHLILMSPVKVSLNLVAVKASRHMVIFIILSTKVSTFKNARHYGRRINLISFFLGMGQSWKATVFLAARILFHSGFSYCIKAELCSKVWNTYWLSSVWFWDPCCWVSTEFASGWSLCQWLISWRCSVGQTGVSMT